MAKENCILCASEKCFSFHVDHLRPYCKCPECGLVFVPPEHHLSPVEEKRFYEISPNDSQDDRYKTFLCKLVDPLLGFLSPGWSGLDFGSGTGPTLNLMLEERGFPMKIWDPFFAPDRNVLENQYDFITVSETAEHFCNPGREWRLLKNLLRPGGCIGVMTQLLSDESRFPNWQYKNEETHVCFYSRRTFEWIGDWIGLNTYFFGNSVIVLAES